MRMLGRKTDFEEVVIIKNEFAWDIEDFLDQAIRTKMSERRLNQGGRAKHAEEIVGQVIQ